VSGLSTAKGEGAETHVVLLSMIREYGGVVMSALVGVEKMPAHKSAGAMTTRKKRVIVVRRKFD
jgi:hypothetical protein